MRTYSSEIAEAIKAHIKETDLHMVSFDEALGSFSFNMQLACQLSTNIIIRVGEDNFTTMAVRYAPTQATQSSWQEWLNSCAAPTSD